MMKKLLIATAMASLATLAEAEPIQLVNGDGSEVSEMCISAVESDALGLSPLEKRDILCNGMPLDRFVKKMRFELASLDPSYYSFTMNDESELTRLCMAAVDSEEAYTATKKELFGNSADLEDNVLCNDMPIRAFARKYRNRAVTAGL